MEASHLAHARWEAAESHEDMQLEPLCYIVIYKASKRLAHRITLKATEHDCHPCSAIEQAQRVTKPDRRVHDACHVLRN